MLNPLAPKKVWTPKPAHSYKELYATYGNPALASFERDNIVTISLQVQKEMRHVHCHKLIAPKLQAVWAELKQGGNLDTVKTYDGCYDVRNIRGVAAPSLHSWGLAIDLNAAVLPLGSLMRQEHMLTMAFLNQGFFYGGDFRKRKDPMHYEYTDGTI